jgi:hypothetical protein
MPLSPGLFLVLSIDHACVQYQCISVWVRQCATMYSCVRLSLCVCACMHRNVSVRVSPSTIS